MFMWTSRRNGLASSGLILVAFTLGCTSTHAGTEDPIRRASADDVKKVQESIAALVKTRDDLPEEPVSLLKLEKPLYWSAAQSGRLLVPVTIRFKGVANSYCRIATWNPDQANAVLVEVPEQANYDECRGFDTVRYLDINRDNVLDIATSFSVKSNSVRGYVAEQAVFLSGANTPSGYCYSEKASRNLRPEQMQSEIKIKQALDNELKRIGETQFECM